MTKTILGVFTDRNSAEVAIGNLRDQGFDPKKMSVVMKDVSEGREMAENTGADVARGAVSGGTAGAVLGGLVGLLASLAIPGLGTIFIGGPLAASLGLTGAAATTASGAATGALAGGLLGAISGLGLTDEEAKVYEEHVKQGGILLAVPANEDEDADVRETMSNSGASEITSISTRDRI